MSFVVAFSVDEHDRRASVVERVKALGDWAILTLNTHYFAGEVKPGEALETIQPMLGPQDALWVFAVYNPWAGHGDPLADDDVAGTLGPGEDWIPRDWDDATESRPYPFAPSS